MKDAFYFQHDYNARNDPKLQDVLIEHGAAGIGIFWCIIEQLYEQGGILSLRSYKSIAFALHVEFEVVESIVRDFDLFETDDTHFWSNSVRTRLGKRNEISERRKNAAISRWKSDKEKQVQCKSDANAEQVQCNVYPKKRKEKESNSKELDNSMWAKTTKRFCPPTLSEVKSYVEEKGYVGFDVERFIDFYTSKGWMVGKNKMKDWQAAVRNWRKGDKTSLSQNRRQQDQDKKNINGEWEK